MHGHMNIKFTCFLWQYHSINAFFSFFYHRHHVNYQIQVPSRNTLRAGGRCTFVQDLLCIYCQKVEPMDFLKSIAA